MVPAARKPAGVRLRIRPDASTLSMALTALVIVHPFGLSATFVEATVLGSIGPLNTTLYAVFRGTPVMLLAGLVERIDGTVGAGG